MRLVALFIALLFLLSYFAGMGQQKMQEVNVVLNNESDMAFYGAIAIEQERAPVNGEETYMSYKAQNNLSCINKIMSATTLITASIDPALQKKISDTQNAFNLYSYPNYGNAISMGSLFTRKI